MNKMSMKITRNIFGTDVEIELTASELSDAFDEVRRYNTYEMLNERLMQEEGIKKDIPAELFEKMVAEVMEEEEGFDESMGSNIFPAMNAVIERHKDELKKEPKKMRTFRIAFDRLCQDEEDNPYDSVPDCTEFDTECETPVEIMNDLINLFNDFVAENRFENVTITQIKEVPYDGEEE